jgi:protocatechuate 3,4-dioxygenase alpha subunit
MRDKLGYLKETAAQTAGPYVHIGLIPRQAGFEIFERDFGNVLVTPRTAGERIRIEGRIFDGLGAPLRDALVEIWQANAAGRYNHPADQQDKPLDPDFRGFGRAGSDFETGIFAFDTIKPGAVTGPGGRVMAPHVNIWLAARGINIGLHTRLYFADETAMNAADPLLNLIDNTERRKTLLAEREERRGQVIYRFDIHLQGARETVFLDV